MSGGPQRYQRSPNNHSQHHGQYQRSSQTPDLYSYGHPSLEVSNRLNESSAKLAELSNERSELKESLEFLECERKVLIDSAKELRESLNNERSQSRKDQDELKKQITDLIAARIKAESQLTRNEAEMNDVRFQLRKLSDDLASKDKLIETLRKNLQNLQLENEELKAVNEQVQSMMTEKLKYNGYIASSPEAQHNDNADNHANNHNSDCSSIVTEMAKLRLELNEKEKLLEGYKKQNACNTHNPPPCLNDMDSLNEFLDRTVECIKGWPEDIASSSHVQDLMKTLLKTYRSDEGDLTTKLHQVRI